jgi:hypothetical protein
MLFAYELLRYSQHTSCQRTACGDATEAGGRRVTERPILTEINTPEGVRVVLFADTWLEHIIAPRTGHTELQSHLAAVLETVSSPDHREADGWPGRERFFKRDVGPSRWLLVVVEYGDEPARIVTALGYRHGRSPRAHYEREDR